MPARDGEIYTLRLGNSPKLFDVEVVITRALLTQGLSGRDALPPGRGMLFIFESLAEQSMWMPDMKFALDIIWLDENLTVIHVTEGAPPCPSRDQCPNYSSRFMARYAIEMTAGQAGAYGFAPGLALRVAGGPYPRKEYK